MKDKKLYKAIVITLVFTLLSGALRKWVLSGGGISNIILLVQLTIPFIFILLSPQKSWKWDYRLLFTVYLFLLITMALNPLNLTIYHGVLGMVLHLGFWFALFHYLNIRTTIQFPRQILLLIILCFAEIFLGFFQYNLPSDHFLNKYVVEEASIAEVGNAVRVTGSFSYISGYNAFLIFLCLFIWALSISKLHRFATIILLLLLPLATLISGSRASFFLSALMMLIISYELFRTSITTPIFGVFIGIIVFTANIGGAKDFLISSFDNLATRIEENTQVGEQERRIVGPIEEIIDFKGNYPIFGVGLGATYQGAISLFGQSIFVIEYGGYEEEPERIVLEGGYILFFFRILLIAFTISKAHIPSMFSIPLFFLILFYFPFVFNTYNAYFFLVGFILVDLAYQSKQQSAPILQ